LAIHDLWLDVTREAGLNDLRRKEIITVALGQLAADLRGKGRSEALETMKQLAAQHNGEGWIMARKSAFNPKSDVAVRSHSPKR
jgi:hypothetical protein